MKNNLLSVFSLIVFAALCSASSFAQDDRRIISAASNLYVISVNAGGVNFVEGEVSVTRSQAKSGVLLKGDELKIGDQLATGANGKAEILLNPGSFVRLAENSNFEFVTTSLDDLQLKLNSGSAMFEVITDAEFSFTVATPKASFHIIKSGVYRIDAGSGGAASKIEVWKGRARTGDAEIKGGKQAIVSGNDLTVAKFNRGDKDSLEVWSKARAKQLAKMNAQLQNSVTRASLVRSYAGSGWNLYNSYGLWVYNSAFGSSCFLPFGYGWNSPYGHYYRRDIWHYRLPPVIYNQPPPRTVVTPTRGGLGTAATLPNINTKNTQTNSEDTPVRSVPPYRRIQKDIEMYPTGIRTDDFSSPNSYPQMRTSPMQTDSSRSSPVAPAPSLPAPKTRDN